VFNASNGFKLRTNVGRVPAKFIFDSEAGTISAWTLTDPIQMNVRTKLVMQGAVFKGLGSGSSTARRCYAADFGHSRVWVVDSYNFRTGDHRGKLRRPNGDPIASTASGALRFGNGVVGGPRDLLGSAPASIMRRKGCWG